MEVKICPKCNKHNRVTAWSCKRCDYDLKSVVITKLPSNETSNKNINPVELNNENQTAKKKSRIPIFASRFMLGFLGWYICISLILGIVFLLIDRMGPSGIILVPFSFIPILFTLLAILLAFRKSLFRKGQVPQRNKGMAFGIITAYSINFIMNLILNMRSDPLAIVGSILGWPFYLTYLENLFR